MFERFDDSGRRVVVLAQEQARLLEHGYIGTEHLLLGILAYDGPLTDALEQRGASHEAVRDRVEEILGPSAGTPPGYIPFTPRAKEVLELSLREAMRLGHRPIGPAHLLLGLLREGQGVGCQALVALGADVRQLRAVAEEVASQHLDPDDEETTPTPGEISLADARAALHVFEERFGDATSLTFLRVRDPGHVRVIVRRPGADDLELWSVVNRGNGWEIEET